MITITLEFTSQEAVALAVVAKRLDYDAVGRMFRPRQGRMTPSAPDQQAAWRALRKLATALPVG